MQYMNTVIISKITKYKTDMPLTYSGDNVFKTSSTQVLYRCTPFNHSGCSWVF